MWMRRIVCCGVMGAACAAARGEHAIRIGSAPDEIPEAVLFPFDSWSVPFRHGLELRLVKAERYAGNPVLSRSGPDAPDGDNISYYGTVIEEAGRFRMWYLGGGKGPGSTLRICYAESDDGLRWRRPKLGLVEYNGSRDNNLVDLDWKGRAMSCVVLHEPADPDPSRRYKIFCEVESETSRHQGCVAFSADGLRWKPSPRNPVTHARIEPTGLVRRNGCYYVAGQNAGYDRGFQKRVLLTLASYDFERWTEGCVLGFRRDDVPPRPVLPENNMGRQVHIGAGLWDRGNVVLGLYGLWDGAAHTGDRREMRMDVGFVITHDGLHYTEPVPDFRIIDSFEEGWSSDNPAGDPPRLSQGQGMANVGERTLTWYGIWGPGGGTSIRVATWRRDRLGYFCTVAEPKEGQTWIPEVPPHFVSAPLRVGGEGGRVFVNADVFGEHAELRVELLDERFAPIQGFSGEGCVPIREGGLRVPVAWKAGDRIVPGDAPVRVRVTWAGVRPEDCRVYAVYVGG